jgi:curved DNA-binding protein CbpA
MKKYYVTLGLKNGASQEEIQAAYEKLSNELNPDKNNNEAFFVEEYKKVQEAYKALSHSSILATEKGALGQKDLGSDSKQKESLNYQHFKDESKTSKRDYAFGGLLFFIATGIWGVFLQNLGFFVPSNDYTQKVRVVNTVDTYVNGGELNVSGNVDVGNTVDVNLEAINGYYNAFYNSNDKHEDEYYRIPVYNYNN